MDQSSDSGPSPQDRVRAAEEGSPMRDEGADLGEEQEFEELVTTIGQALAEGRSQESIVNDIVGVDADEETRHSVSELVFNIANTLAEHQSHASEGSGVSSWVIWIGLLVFVNILSSAFDWGFIIY